VAPLRSGFDEDPHASRVENAVGGEVAPLERAQGSLPARAAHPPLERRGETGLGPARIAPGATGGSLRETRSSSRRPDEARGRKGERVFHELAVEQRHPRLEADGHRGAVDEHEVVVGQVGVDVERQEALDEGKIRTVEFPEEPGGVLGARGRAPASAPRP
jgi:hypothetical protein